MTEEIIPKEEPPKKGLKKAAAGTAAGLAAASLVVGSIFSNPSEIMAQVNPDKEQPVVIVQMDAKPDDEIEAEEEDTDEKKKGLKEMLRRFVQRLPAWAKVLFVIPMWALGYGVIALLTALFEPVIAPVLGIVLKWLLVAGLLAAAFFLIKKTVAPDTPLREIFSKRNLVLITISAALLGAGDYFAKAYIEHYEVWRNVLCFAAGLVILGVFGLRSMKRKKKAV